MEVVPFTRQEESHTGPSGPANAYSHPKGMTGCPSNHVIAADQKASVFVGRCEYILADDGSVQHRLIGNTTFLSCRNSQFPTPDEKLALELLLAMEPQQQDEELCYDI